MDMLGRQTVAYLESVQVVTDFLVKVGEAVTVPIEELVQAIWETWRKQI
jgi:hypothetical protein